MCTVPAFEALPHAQQGFEQLLQRTASHFGGLTPDDVFLGVQRAAERDFPGLSVQLVEDEGRFACAQVLEVVSRPANRYRHVNHIFLARAGARVGQDKLLLPLAVTYSDVGEEMLEADRIDSAEWTALAESVGNAGALLGQLLRLRPQELPVAPVVPNSTHTLDDDTYASNAGQIQLSEEKLRRLEPWLFEHAIGFFRRMVSVKSREAAFWRRRIPEQLRHGDGRAAVVVATEPLAVAAYSDEIDNILVVEFPREVDDAGWMKVGDRLLTVNTYDTYIATDCINGPAAYMRYGTFVPYIAEMLSDDDKRIAERKQEIQPWEWRRTEFCARKWAARQGARARDGRPTRVHHPAP